MPRICRTGYNRCPVMNSPQMKRVVFLVGMAASVGILGSVRPFSLLRSPVAPFARRPGAARPGSRTGRARAAGDQLAGAAAAGRSHPAGDGRGPQPARRRHGKATEPAVVDCVPAGRAILVTERPGRLRIFRNGVLDPAPVAGVPAVRAAGLQGLMDVVLHPRFAENKWIYLSYHKPMGTPVPPARGNGPPVAPEGATTIARGTWDGTALTNVKDIFETGATVTESSRIAFGRDGMLYMTVERSRHRSPGRPLAGPDRLRRQDDSAARRWDGAAGQSVRGQGGLQAGDLHGRPSERPLAGRQSGDR